MILNNRIDVKIYSKNSNYYKNLGYINIKNNDIINIPIEELSSGSHVKVDVKCDICGSIKKLSYQKYLSNITRQEYYSCSQKCGNKKRTITNTEIYGFDYLIQNTEIKNRIKETNILKYGTVNPFESEICKEKIRKTCLDKFGFDHPMQNNEIKNKSLKNRFVKIVKEDSFYQIYKNDVRKLTNRNRKTLFNNWNGYDYYDNEFIKDYFSFNSNDFRYPTLDHKISVSYGFLNGICAEEISKIDNLCITKKSINSSKNNK